MIASNVESTEQREPRVSKRQEIGRLAQVQVRAPGRLLRAEAQADKPYSPTLLQSSYCSVLTVRAQILTRLCGAARHLIKLTTKASSPQLTTHSTFAPGIGSPHPTGSPPWGSCYGRTHSASSAEASQVQRQRPLNSTCLPQWTLALTW